KCGTDLNKSVFPISFINKSFTVRENLFKRIGVEKDNNNNNPQSLNEKVGSRKGKSCKGCLYYSSTLKSNSRNPLCVGITSSLPKVPRYYVGESEMEASKEGRSLADFRYGCVGYSVYPDMKNHNGDVEETKKELPVCVGIEVLVDKVTNGNPAPTHAHKKDNHATPRPRIYQKCKYSGIRCGKERTQSRESNKGKR
ncbi:hypothetical protein M8C21_014469, partial [Ambrosia artemisiifolia]